MPFVGTGSSASIGWWRRFAADGACPITAEEIQYFKDTVAGLLCMKDVAAPDYSLALFVLDGGAVIVAEYDINTTTHELSIFGTGVEEETIPLTLAQEESCRQLFNASCGS